MNREIQQRLLWVKLYETSGDVRIVCRCRGISRHGLHKGWRRYLAQGIVGLENHSRRPKRLPATKASLNEVAILLELRTLRNLGTGRIRGELKRLHSLSLAIATIHKILCRHQVKLAAPQYPTYALFTCSGEEGAGLKRLC